MAFLDDTGVTDLVTRLRTYFAALTHTHAASDVTSGTLDAARIPEMSSDTRGGAKLEAKGGLALRDGALGIGSLVQSGTQVTGPIAHATAKGHAEQASTTGKNLCPRASASQTINDVTFTVNADGSVTANGTASARTDFKLAENVVFSEGTYTISGALPTTNNGQYNVRCEDHAEPKTQRMRNDGTTESSNTPTGIIPANTPQDLIIRIYSGITVSNLTFYPQLELGSTATSYEPYTGGAPSPRPDWEQPIKVARGRNLARPYVFSDTVNNVMFDYRSDGSVHLSGTAGSDAVSPLISQSNTFKITLDAGTYIPSLIGGKSGIGINVQNYDSNSQLSNGGAFTLTATTNVMVRVSVASGTVTNCTVLVQLELGSTPTPYVPYGHVGLEVRDATTDALMSVTAIPLPSRGWVADLPDGTSDTLTLDGAGKCEWELENGEYTITGSETYGSDEQIGNYRRIASWSALASNPGKPESANLSGLFTHAPFEINWSKQSNHAYCFGNSIVLIAEGTSKEDVLSKYTGAKFLYPIATPVVEDCGYVDLPSIPAHATTSIPELDDLGVDYFIDQSVMTLAQQWYERAYAELGDAITELAGRVAAIEQTS